MSACAALFAHTISFSSFNCHPSFHSTVLNWKTTQGILGRINRCWNPFWKAKSWTSVVIIFIAMHKVPFFPSSANYCRTFCSVFSEKSKNCAIFISCRRMKIISLCSQANYCSCLCAINMVKTFLWLIIIIIIKREGTWKETCL